MSDTDIGETVAWHKYQSGTANQTELVHAVIDARIVQMETEDTPFVIEWLMEHHSSFSIDLARRVLDNETSRYVALYPEGHLGLEAMYAAYCEG